jgi:hypothetical protein
MIETSDMTLEGLWEVFKGDFTDTAAIKIPLMLLGGKAEGLACTDLMN